MKVRCIRIGEDDQPVVIVLRKSDPGILERETRGSISTYLSSVNPLVASVPALGVIHSYPTWLIFGRCGGGCGRFVRLCSG